MAVAEAPCSRILQISAMCAAPLITLHSSTWGICCVAATKSFTFVSSACKSPAASSIIIQARPSGSKAISRALRPRVCKPPTIVQSIPSIAMGLNGSMSRTASPASNISLKPKTRSCLTAGFSISLTRAPSIDTQVPSLPTRARARLKPFSGNS